MTIQHLFVPRNRLVSFNVRVRIDDVNNVPPLSGMFYVKWRCQDHTGSTSRIPVTNREVRWSHTIERQMYVPMTKELVLSPCEIKLTVKQASVDPETGYLEPCNWQDRRIAEWISAHLAQMFQLARDNANRITT
ncbi:hypothetical protein EC988_001914 [Linderina pennispora]|nr:hypothetical protein EC988_001914 [Linderina pennispora]